MNPVLASLNKIKENHPNLRICQIIGNCFNETDLYYVTDEELMVKLYENYGNRKEG